MMQPLRAASPRFRTALAAMLRGGVAPASAVLWGLSKAGIRLGVLEHAGRIGHLTAHTFRYLQRRALGLEPSREQLLVFCDRPANRALLRILQRELTIIQSPLLFRAARRLKIHDPTNPVWKELPGGFMEFDRALRAGPPVSLTAQEEAAGRAGLEAMGLDPRVPFVCFHARDSAYLDKVQAHRGAGGWSYHNHRNGNIENILPAAKWLAEKGIPALRMGAIVEAALPDVHPLVIDYATKHRRDFMDVYLLARCLFFIGNTAGPLVTASMLGTPIAALNWIPWGTLSFWGRNNFFIPKKLFSESKGRYLTFPEVIGTAIDSFPTDAHYEEAGIRVEENTADEILAFIQEMHRRLEGTWLETAQDELLRVRYEVLFGNGHRAAGSPGMIATSFLRSHKELLEHPAGTARGEPPSPKQASGVGASASHAVRA